MVNRINRNTPREIDKLTPSDAAAARSYIAKNRASRNPHSNDNIIIDEVIALLANAHENRRARQVTEWERLRGANAQQAA
ncbi:MAG: hypothetical protein ACKVQJ_13355 [Pyrinomonadaceae bacterium]